MRSEDLLYRRISFPHRAADTASKSVSCDADRPEASQTVISRDPPSAPSVRSTARFPSETAMRIRASISSETSSFGSLPARKMKTLLSPAASTRPPGSAKSSGITVFS